MNAPDERTAGLALMREMVPVSRETEGRLDTYASLLVRWQRAKNLVAPATLPGLWTRHFADSAQALAALPQARRWVDLGAGAGFPGLVVAILLAEEPDADIHLVEANARKCTFLRTVIRETGVRAHVHNQRISACMESFDAPVDAVAARALAPLPELVAMSAPLIARGAVAVFHKGQDVEGELTQAARYWKLEYELVPSRTDDRSALVILRDCAAKSA